MKKLALILFTVMITASLSACGGNPISEELDNIQLEDTTSSEEETTTESDSSEDGDSIDWPDFLPTEIPEIEDVPVVSCYPNEANASNYTLEITVNEGDKSLLDAYAEALTSAGFTQDPVQENNFGIDYNFSSEDYGIFINAVYGGYSKLAITIY